MKQIEIQKLSKRYTVRRLTAKDVDRIYALCRKNTQYYEYCGKEPSIEWIQQDLTITPPGIPMEKKYYLGFWEEEQLVAVMDLIDGYPQPDCA